MRHIIHEAVESLLSGPLSGSKWRQYNAAQIHQMYIDEVLRLSKDIYQDKPFETTPFYALHIVVENKLKKSQSVSSSLEALSQYIL